MNSSIRASHATRRQLGALLALSLIWLAPTLACGSFAPRPTPTPTPPPEISAVATDPTTNEPDVQTMPTPLPVAPTDTPTPEATATLTPTVVTGAALTPGGQARVTAPAGLNYRDLPSTGANLLGQFGAGILVTVLDGPVTADEFIWWQIDDGQGNVGWAAEGDGETEWISPRLGEPQPANRAPQVGDRVRVTMPVGGQLSVRNSPGVNAALLARVNPGQEYTVLAGPQQTDGFTWYQIRSDDGALEGWAADGDGTDRWLSPLE